MIDSPTATVRPRLAFMMLLCLSAESVAGDGGEWSIETPPGPGREVAIDVAEGTWMSVDVSPDGRWIVFDLLGDLYRMPAAGGEAEALTEGLAWDMQPRYSPDGEMLAFTSDRGGGNNLWLMASDGGEPRPVSRETRRLVNSPAWTPDGRFVAGRKHFTAARPLGAGEIWLYHRSGSGGLRMTERPNDEKDLGEPAFSPDGRYLYFSQDVTPGARFQYDKDSNREIYVIQRLDRASGEIERFVTGPGGSVRPTPSPDGRWLAFVRRVRAKSVLFLHDVVSGTERPLYDRLDRDMQEAWAIHGVYPAMAWTPDSRSIVFWAGGKIRRLDLHSGEVAEIPFRVRSTRRVVEALRARRPAAPRRFRPRMLRWVEVSPAGDRVVYEALGRLWIRNLPVGEPRRLTRQEEHFELWPSFSADGGSIVYATWSDDRLGSVRVAPAGGGEGRRLTAEAGHYVEPAFSPDGAKVVFRKVAGGLLRTPAWARDTGLYWLPAAGGTARKITAAGRLPRFDPRADPEAPRVFFLDVEAGGERILKSIDLDGGEPRGHLRFAAATDARLSPDGRWIAFREYFRLYLAPFVATGEAIELGAATTSIPVREVSRRSGDYLHFSGDGSTLHWTLGPELFSRDLKDVFGFLPGAPEPLPEPPEIGLDVSFEASADVPEGRIAIVGGRLLTMRGEEVIERGTVLVDGDRIVAVGGAGEVEVPPDATVIEAHGMTVLPGLIDVHDHSTDGTDGIVPQRNWMYYARLAFGVTTTHEPAEAVNAEPFAARDMVRAGVVLGPRIFSTGASLNAARLPTRADVESLDDARFHVERLRAQGAFSVKSYLQPRRDQRQQILAAGRELGMLVVPEGGSLFHNNMTMVVDGHTGVEHCLPVARVYEDVLSLWAATEVGYTPALGVAFGGLRGKNYWYQHTEVWNHPRLARFVPRQRIDPLARRRKLVPEEEYNFLNAAAVAARLASRGVPVQVGSHGEREGLAVHWEIWMLVQGGMSPHQALRAATSGGAAYLGLDGDLGSLEPGKLADLIVLDADPLAEIRNSESVRYTMLGGRLYDARTLDRLAPDPAPRGRLFWELESGGGAPP